MKKFIFLAALLLSPLASFADEIPLIHNIYNRDRISLNGKWRYIVDVQENGFYDYRHNESRNGFFRNQKAKDETELVEYDFDKSQQMDIPGDWNTQDDRLFFYEGTVWFKRSFNYHPQAGKRAILYFGAVNYEAIVYLNGRKLGRHVGGFTAFNYDVTDIVKEGDNFVIVKVDNKRHRDNIPTDIFDWWNYGGITRDVFIAQVDDTYIQNYSLQLDRATRSQLQGWVQLNEKKAGVTITLRIPELKLSRTLTTDAEGRAQFSVKAKPVLWSPENPKQYEVEWQMGGSTLKDQMGFRTIETKGKTILLNGKPVFLRGVSIHEEAPYRQGRAHTAEDAHTLLSWAKEMGCNYVRLAHYPHNELAVREAEKMGIMVWSEIPVYWTISWENPETYANAQRQLTDMISRDRNRAAIVIWSIANETPHSAPRDRFLGNLATYARSLDDTRLISMAMEVTSARNYVNRLQDNLNEFVDVISFNEYVGWYRDPKDAPKMTWEIPYDKPVIVSEFGGGALKGKYGDKYARFTEENQENIYRENLKMLEKIDGLAGLSPWILVDFRSPRRQLADVQDFFNRKGLVSSTGEKKKAFYVMQEFYRKKKESSF